MDVVRRLASAAWAGIWIAGCGGSPPPSPLAGLDVRVVAIEWRVLPGEPGSVDVEIVVDGTIAKLGAVAATPETCAIRSAAANTTELLCGDSTFDANLDAGYVVVLRDGRERRRFEVGSSVALTVAPYRIPVAPELAAPAGPGDASVP